MALNRRIEQAKSNKLEEEKFARKRELEKRPTGMDAEYVKRHKSWLAKFVKKIFG